MKDKVVIITGGTSGIGKACAEAFGQAGANIVISGRNYERLLATEKAIKSKGINITAVNADVSSEVDCNILVDRAVKNYGKIDVLINNAGISMRALFEEADTSVIKQLMDINFYGTVHMTRLVLPYLKKTQGSVVGVSSIAGRRGLPLRTGYSASKFAMEGFLEALRVELLNDRIHVLSVRPGFTSSNIRSNALAADGSTQEKSPLNEGRIMSSEQVAARILKAVIARKRVLALTTQGKFTLYLNKFFPAFMDKIIYRHFQKEEDSPLQKKSS